MHIDSRNDSLSYWHATQKPIIPVESLPTTAEVVVIGGGMLGVWTTYWLARAGVPVVLLEKSAIGWGATGRNGGFLTCGAAMSYSSLIELLGRETARNLYALTTRGVQLAHEVVKEEEVQCDLRQTGTLSLSLTEANVEQTQKQCELLHEDGFDVESLDRNGVQGLIATPLANEVLGGSIIPSGGLLHSSRYLAGLARAAERHGARIVRAEAISLTANVRTSHIETNIGVIDAERVIVALNAWTDTLVPESRGVIVPTRGQILAYEPTEQVFTTATGTDITPTGEYWQQTMDGSIVIGGCRADAPNKDSNVRDMVSTPDVIACLEAVIPRLFPDLSHLKVARRWAGLMAFTPDYLPVVDAKDDNASTWYAGGFCGHGMPFGPIVGKYLAQAAIEGQLSSDVSMLARRRASLQAG